MKPGIFRDWSDDLWLADDKGAHFGLGAVYWLLLDKLFTFPLAASLFVGGVVVWELVELVRYFEYGWARDFSDQVSLKDMLLSVAGGVVAALLC